MSAFGCGDDDGGGRADARPDDDDASPGDSDASPFVPTFDSPEGGEVRYEYVRFTNPPGPGGRTTGARVTSFFMSSTSGDADPNPIPALEACTNMTNNDTWPTGQEDTRTYIDVGEVIIAGGGEPLSVPLVDQSGGTVPDFLAREHDHYYFHFGIDDTDVHTLPNRSYDVFLSGSDEWPAQVYEDALFMPAEFGELDPPTGPVMLEAGTDLEMTWEVTETEGLPAGVEVLAVIAFGISGQGVSHACVAANDGSFTVPAATVDEVRATGGPGFIARQTFVHNLKELNNGDDVSGRRVDFLSVWCYVTPWAVAAIAK